MKAAPVLKGKHLGARAVALAAMDSAEQFPGKLFSVHIFESAAIVTTLLDGELQALRYVHNGVSTEAEVGMFNLWPPRPDDVEFDDADYRDPLAEAQVDPETAAEMLASAGVKPPRK